MSPNNSSEVASTEPLFRPLKRRRFYRKRAGKDNIETRGDDRTLVELTALPPPEPLEENEGDTDESARLDMAEILRLRKLRQRRNGIEFTTPRPPGSGSGTPQPDANEDAEMAPEEVKKVVNRFAPQTGQVMDVNKHMMAYIDSEMARRCEGNSTTPQPEAGNVASFVTRDQVNAVAVPPLQRQPAALGKLHEIDLGPDSTRTNIERTVKMLENGEKLEEIPTQGKVRLGKDGKPWRGRKRRTSEDIQRDKLVEEVLRESRLEIYDEVEPPTKPDDEQAADDRIAEQFRREFMDAISSRRRRTAPSAAKGGKKKDERPKGPKLGGSRSARAAMREQQEKAAGRK
ncbi:hypothetical protein FGG08_006248 [Glutinoglossum americanum]|uniref:Hepatocellular carcinoma-associated antigen 59-domain-containing protein n=1 Tax=Glutinoglossum americanum TaxID=1670608 RepID=A0A9P8I7R7_9PEZI|nr:hypothetical protein FGG08_006248 [Glutinoglossum americanum]